MVDRGEGFFIQAGNLDSQGPVNREYGLQGDFTDHGSQVDANGGVHNAYPPSSGDSSCNVEEADVDANADPSPDLETEVEEPVDEGEGLTSVHETPHGTVHNYISPGAVVLGRIFQGGDFNGPINL